MLQYSQTDCCLTHWVKQKLLIIIINLLPKDLYNTLFLCYFGDYLLNQNIGVIDDILTTLIVMQNEGARCLSDVRHLHGKSELLKREGTDKLPGVDTLSRWLRRHGRAGISLINQLNQTVIAKTLKFQQVKEVTLDIDATVIETEKVSATWTYHKKQGFTMMVGTPAETGQVIAAELRDGYVSPNTDNAGFIETCRKLLPSGTTLRRVRTEAAGYQHQVIDYLTSHEMEFLIRAAMNESIAKQIGALSEQDWQPLQSRDGKLSQHQWVARCRHTMYRSDLALDLVVQRTYKRQAAKIVQQVRQWQLKLQEAYHNLLSRVFRNLLDTIGQVLPDLKIPLLN